MQNQKLKNIFNPQVVSFVFGFLILVGIFFSFSASAAGLVPCGDGNDPTQRCTLCHLVIGFQGLINYGRTIFVVLALLMLMAAGILYIVSSGDQGMIGTSKAMMKNAVLGFSFVLLAWLIVNYTIFLLGAKVGLSEKPGAKWNEFTCDRTPTPMLNPAPVGGGGASGGF